MRVSSEEKRNGAVRSWFLLSRAIKIHLSSGGRGKKEKKDKGGKNNGGSRLSADPDQKGD